MSGLNGSAGSRRAPVVRSADEWSGIMADFERSGAVATGVLRVPWAVLEDLLELAVPSPPWGREGILCRACAAGFLGLGRRA